MSESAEIPRIKRLSSTLANQIAAGEVIERPASVIKELLENCLDADAGRIVIEVGKAGSRFIRVTDNGHGIHPEDLQLALERHATAKLSDASDLMAIRSLGFRGEALPSISSVAALTLTSRIMSMEQAVRLTIDPESGRSECRPAAHPVGTTVEVRNLFHNTPARKKFLRSERTEFLHILEMVRRLALSRSDVSMELRHNDRKILTCRAAGDNSGARVAGLLGQAFIRQALALDCEAGDMRLCGWLGVGDLARSTTDKQYFYLNGRMIRDPRLNHAIRLACEGQLAGGRFPSYVLYLELDLQAADVNVHPSKHEVRFRHARDVHDFIYAALSKALADDSDLYSDPGPESDEQGQEMSSVNAGSPYRQRHNIIGEVRTSYGELYARGQSDLSGDVPVLGKVLLQILPNYILTRRGTGILLINIEAAKKHLVLTKLKSLGSGVTIKARPLLVPVSFAVSEEQEKVFSSLCPLLEDYAMHLALAGPGRCMVRAIPGLLAQADLVTLVEDILSLNVSDRPVTEIREALMLTLVRHVNDIPNPLMSMDEMTNLLRQLENSGLDASRASHAPIWISLSEADLAGIMAGND